MAYLRSYGHIIGWPEVKIGCPVCWIDSVQKVASRPPHHGQNTEIRGCDGTAIWRCAAMFCSLGTFDAPENMEFMNGDGFIPGGLESAGAGGRQICCPRLLHGWRRICRSRYCRDC